MRNKWGAQKRRIVINVLTILMAFLVLPACTKIAIKDDLGPSKIKGYVEFFSYEDVSFSVYCEQDGAKESSPHFFASSRGIRMAKTPGDYTFIVKGSNLEQKVNVRIVANATIYITVDKKVLSRESGTAFGIIRNSSSLVPGFGIAFGTTETIALTLSVGTHPIPWNITAASEPALLAALYDPDRRTRIYAVEGLGKIDPLAKERVLKGLNELAIFDSAEKVRDKAAAQLNKAGREPAWPEKLTILGGEDIPYYAGWAVSQDTYASSEFNAGAYIMESLVSGCTWNTVGPAIPLPENFDIELRSTWKSGLKAREYGLVLGKDGKRFIAFGISADGQAGMGSVIAEKNQADSIPWKPVAALRPGNGKNANLQRVEVRGKTIAYYVNNALVGTIQRDERDDRVLGARVCNRQKASFDQLSIIKR